MKTLADRMNNVANSDQFHDEFSERVIELTKQDAAFGDDEAVEELESEEAFCVCVPEIEITATGLEALAVALHHSERLALLLVDLVEGQTIDHQVARRASIRMLVAFGELQDGRRAMGVIDQQKLSPDEKERYLTALRGLHRGDIDILSEADFLDVGKDLEVGGAVAPNVIEFLWIAHLLRYSPELWAEFQQRLLGQ